MFDLGLWMVLRYDFFFYYVLLSLFYVNFIVFQVFNIIVFLWGLMFKIHNLFVDHWISSFNGRPFHVHLRVSFRYSFSQESVHGLWTQRFSPSYLFPWSSNYVYSLWLLCPRRHLILYPLRLKFLSPNVNITRRICDWSWI